MEINYEEKAKDYLADYLYELAEQKIDEKYGDTISDRDRTVNIDSEYDGLVDYIKINLGK